MEPSQETVSEGGVKLSGPKPRVSKKGLAAPKLVTTRTAAKIRAKAILSCRKAPKAEEKAPKGGEAAKAQTGEAEPESTLADKAGTSCALPLEPPAEEAPQTLSPTRPPGDAGEKLLPQLPALEGEDILGLPSDLNPLPSKNLWGEPARKKAKINPEATFTPTAAGLRPDEAQEEPEMTPEMKLIISQAIAQGIAAAIGQNQQAALLTGPDHDDASQQEEPVASDDPMDVQGLPKPPSPATSTHVQESHAGTEEPSRPSEEEAVMPIDPLSMPGSLFRPDMFKTLLQRAKATTRLGVGPAASEPSDSANSSSELPAEMEDIPSPKLFLDVVQRPWTHPGGYLNPSTNERRFYNVDPDLKAALEIPVTDGPVVALASSTIVFNNTEDALKPGNKKAELTLRKAHESAAWAVKAALTASFFNRVSLLWLREMKARIPATDIRTHQDLDNLVAAAEFSADATMGTARFASRAIASCVAARRLLWLRHWKATMKSKWKLAAAPYKGEKLFGEALEIMNTQKTQEKKKDGATHTERRTAAFAKKAAAKSAGNAQNAQNVPQPQKAQQPGPANNNKPGFKNQNRQQFQSKQPLQGKGSQPGKNSTDFQRKGTRWGPPLPNSRGRNDQGWNDDIPPYYPTRPRSHFAHDTRPVCYPLPQASNSPYRSYSPTPVGQSSYHSSDFHPGMQGNQMAARAEERPRRQPPDNRSQGSGPYIPDSPTSPPHMMCEPSLPPWSGYNNPNVHEETSYPVSSPSDYPYTRQMLPERPGDSMRHPSRSHRGPTLHELALSESRILNQLRQDLLLSFQQEGGAPRSGYNRHDEYSLPGEHQSSGELDPVRPTKGASSPPHAAVRHDCPLHGHRSHGSSSCQGCSEGPPDLPETWQEPYNYRNPAPSRSGPGMDVPRDGWMHNQESESYRGRYERQILWPERECFEDPCDMRSDVEDDDWRAYGGHTKQYQPLRPPRSPPSPQRDPEYHFRPSRTSPDRRRSQEDPYQSPREYPPQAPYVRTQPLGRTSSSAPPRRT